MLIFLNQIFPLFIKKNIIYETLLYILIQSDDYITVQVKNKTDANTHTRMTFISYQFEIEPIIIVHINVVACQCNKYMTKFLRCMEVLCGLSS